MCFGTDVRFDVRKGPLALAGLLQWAEAEILFLKLTMLVFLETRRNISPICTIWVSVTD